MLLSDDEINAMADAAFRDYMIDKNDDHNNAFARAIESAILAKLASAELPEPVVIDMHVSGYVIRGYKKDQLRQAYAQGAASQLTQEPTALMYQHDETGRVGFLEAWGPVEQFKKSNPRLKIVAKPFTLKEPK